MTRAAKRAGALLMTLAVATAWGCTTQQVNTTPAPVQAAGGEGVAGLGPTLTIERFLQAANAHDWSTMLRLFGTENGPVDWDRQYGERHMSLLAEVLQHRDFEVGTASAVPGRSRPTQMVRVTLEQATRTVENVPFTVVQDGDGNWLIEEIDTVALTGRTR